MMEIKVRSDKRPYQQQQSQEPATTFMLTGVHALLFDDDTLAAFINSSAALLPWNGDQSLLIDRYDVRHLLQDLSSVRKRRPAPPLTDTTEEELNYERFRDLQEIASSTPQEASENSKDYLKPSARGCQAVPFSYSVEETETTTRPESSHTSLGFRPPFHVPDFLLGKLPPSEKHHQIIAGTAKFVKEHGGQSEVLLKVKQGNNPLFGFLNVDHHLHEYYRFLLQHSDILQPTSQDAVKPAEVDQRTGEGLSLLGSAYGSGDDEDEQVLKSETNHVDSVASTLRSSVVGQEGVTTTDGVKLNTSKGSTMVPVKVAAGASSVLLKSGDDSRVKVSENVPVPKAMSQAIKKKKSLGGASDLIQANKRIAPLMKVNDAPAKIPTTVNNELPKKSEAKTSSWHSVPSAKDMNYGMSADAAAAVVLAATRGVRVLKQDSSMNKSSSSSSLSQKVQEASAHPADSTSRGKISNSLGLGLGLGESDVKLAKAVAELAAIAASHEADSADTSLTPAEKLKAERLRKAKMFAAMIKSGKCESETIAKSSEQAPLTSTVTSTKSDDMHTDGLPLNGTVVANGQGTSVASGSLAEEVEDNALNKGGCGGVVELPNKQSAKERKYRSKELHSESDLEESDHQRKRKVRHEHKGDKKHRHKRRKHKNHDSDSSDSESSNGEESNDEQKSKSHHRRHHGRKHSHQDFHQDSDSREGRHGHRKHRSHFDDSYQDSDSREGRHGHRKHRSHYDDLDSSHKKKHKHRKHKDRSSSDNENGSHVNVKPISDSGRVKSTSHHVAQETVSSGHVTLAQHQGDLAAKTEVPADIREKVRAMLLSTL